MTGDAIRQRDERIDIMRGFAMLTIAINHIGVIPAGLGYEGWLFPTHTQYGYSSAAGIFVFFSGYMVGLVYLSRSEARRSLLSRVRTLYVTNAMMCFMSLLVVILFTEHLADVTGFRLFLESPSTGLFGFLLLVIQPLFSDVLTLYILLMLIVVVISPQLERNTLLVVSVSFSVYCLVPISKIFGLTLNLPGGIPGPDADMLWTFNPFAWQFLFIAAAALGRRRVLSYASAVYDDRPSLCFATIMMYIVVVGIFIFDQSTPAFNVRFVSKVDLGPIRIIHTGLVVAALLAIISLLKKHLRALPLRWLSSIGRSTLSCYAVSVPLTYVLALTWIYLGRTEVAYLTSVFSVVAAMTAVSAFVAARKASQSIGRP